MLRDQLPAAMGWCHEIQRGGLEQGTQWGQHQDAASLLAEAALGSALLPSPGSATLMSP